MMLRKSYDVAVIGAGVFGAWTAHQVQRSGLRVLLFDAYGPANGRASSAGESRVIRMNYGANETYTRWAMRSLTLWQEFFQRTGQLLFHRTGVLWLSHDDDTPTVCAATLEKLGVPHEKLSREELGKRYPQVVFDDGAWGVLEPESGALMARRAVQAVVQESLRIGVEYSPEAVVPPKGKGRLASVITRRGTPVRAEAFVFACGPWLPKVFPDLLQQRIFPTRQEVFFFGVPAGDRRFAPPALPVWFFMGDEIYGIPDLENRGLKVASDRHGPPIDPDLDERVVTLEGLRRVREFLARRFPCLRDAPLLETRVCQYENTSNGDFLIDRHPEFDNVWIAGGGSGHGFKHGPALGEYMVALLTKGVVVDTRFSLASKDKVVKRTVH